MKEYKAYTVRNYREIPQLKKLDEEDLKAMEIVSKVLPFKTNSYVIDELINWDDLDNDPIFTLNFPRKEMLSEMQYSKLSELMNSGSDNKGLARYIDDIRQRMNPHPAGQLYHNTPFFNGERIKGIQHKYRETMLLFPAQGQTCHAYCTFCFRWPQFTGMSHIRFAMKETDLVVDYLKQNPEITDVLITGGDPLFMKTSILERYINSILDADLPSIRNIRIGSKSLSFWPYRFVSDPDADDLLRLFEKVTSRGKHLTIMAHFNHHREVETEVVNRAVKRIRRTGAQIRTQSPLIRNINNDPDVWATMWKKQVSMGMIPYYMFIARNTGAQDYFSVNLQSALNIFQEAYRKVSGICRTVRGPSMSAGPGKIHIIGTSVIHGEKVYVLNFIQGRIPEWVGKPFFAKYNKEATWLTDLKPAFDEPEFFYEKEYRKLIRENKLHEESEDEREDLQSA